MFAPEVWPVIMLGVDLRCSANSVVDLPAIALCGDTMQLCKLLTKPHLTLCGAVASKFDIFHRQIGAVCCCAMAHWQRYTNNIGLREFM